MIYINTGSISLPRNNYLPTYSLYDNKKITINSIDNKVIDYIEL